MINRSLHSYRFLAPMLVLGVAAACSGAPGDATSISAPSAAQRVLTTASVGDAGNGVANQGELELCKTGDAGSFEVTDGTTTLSYDLEDGECVVAWVDKGPPSDPAMLTVTELPSTTSTFTSVTKTTVTSEYDPNTNTSGPDFPETVSVSNVSTQQVEVMEYIGSRLVYLNTLNPPPPVCDFITFGRLVLELDGQKVVISGNAGGNAPAGGILGEFHIEMNGTDNHVAVIDSYAAIASGPLAGLPNARVVTGTAKNGVEVELRLYDGGEPGADTDKVFVSLDGGETYTEAFIDQGNMQYHPTCRGPQD
jgi:hypothetical protein